MTIRKIRWIGYGITVVAWTILLLHDWHFSPAQRSRTVGVVLLAVGFAGMTLNVVGGHWESRARKAQQISANAPQSE
jgi:hypothetical protein